jgi:hypothetical protein
VRLVYWRPGTKYYAMQLFRYLTSIIAYQNPNGNCSNLLLTFLTTPSTLTPLSSYLPLTKTTKLRLLVPTTRIGSIRALDGLLPATDETIRDGEEQERTAEAERNEYSDLVLGGYALMSS